MQKWNPKKHDYEPYSVPEEWNTPLVCRDMEMKVNCARCGDALLYGSTYTSRQIHNHIGLGYGVCEKCYQQEWAEEKEAKRHEQAR